MKTVNLNLTAPQLSLLCTQLQDDILSHQNWLHGAVQRNDFDTAKKLAVQVDELRELYATFNGGMKSLTGRYHGEYLATRKEGA